MDPQLFEKPTSWTASVADSLSALTVSSDLTAEIAAEVIDTVRIHGFALVRSTPSALDDESVSQRAAELAVLGAALGTPIMQSRRGELVEDVRDFSDVDAQDDRGYRSPGELLPHSDPPTLILLHCIQPAMRGGESQLVSVAAIIEELHRNAPELVATLRDDFPAWRVDGQHGVAGDGPTEGMAPIIAVDQGTLSCVLYRPFVEQAAKALGRDLTDRQVESLDRFEQLSLSEQLTLRLFLQPGDTLVLHNRSVLHGRTDYEDWPDRSRRRHLLRMWIDAPDAFPVHPIHELGDFFAPR